MMNNLQKLLSIFLTSFAFFVTACNTPARVTYFVQNTHQYMDTLDVYILLAEKSNQIPSIEYKLKAGVEELHHFKVPLGDKNTYYAKTFPLENLANKKEKWIYEVSVYKGKVISSGSMGFPSKSIYTLITMANNGGAYLSKSCTPKGKPKGYKDWHIIADATTRAFLGID